MKTREENLIKFMDCAPPCLVRVMAVTCGKNKKPRLKSLLAIVADSGLSRRTVQRLAVAKTWKDIRIGVASDFIIGCNVDILHSNRSASSGSKRMTRYYFFRHYIEKNLPHLTESQRERLCELMGWK